MSANLVPLIEAKPAMHRKDGSHWLHVPNDPAKPLTIEHTLMCPHDLHNPGNGSPSFVTGYTCGVGCVETAGGARHFFRHIEDVTGVMGADPLKPGRYPIAAHFYPASDAGEQDAIIGQLQLAAG